MKYYEVIFTLTPCSQDAQDLLSALAAEAGFETFEEMPSGLKGYVQQSLFETTVLDRVIESFPFEATHITYNVREAEDRDWNEQWEQEGFEPIIVRGEKKDKNGKSITEIVIHDGRHLPTLDSTVSSSLLIEIDAHMAFGTGTHETTRMICATLLDMNLQGQRVLDCGSGTGILGICALKLGADSCRAYDIDEWSADNTRHNAVINGIDDRLTALCGDSSLLSDSAAEFSLVLANINRNILLADLPRFRSVMVSGATLILSGFYKHDCALLESKAQQLGLTHIATKTDGDWACMVFSL